MATVDTDYFTSIELTGTCGMASNYLATPPGLTVAVTPSVTSTIYRPGAGMGMLGMGDMLGIDGIGDMDGMFFMSSIIFFMSAFMDSQQLCMSLFFTGPPQLGCAMRR
ncbi:hypothetical protein [Candidatus Mycobacterium methanotrophicum]|uniref:Uncharacterized protein n=1 Tax=Candidatus Mycobacterium methanotrophicum TaxID=2943498 RepID=A0ABY4QHF0_9MYCO|nr:hypothetical protein [Candidatus Mycobacterium methanotrophicum]UQX10445.1 hypothetical protein M5I08_20545 [Candidatus Mycobacterium methanotrophicum]